MTTETKNLPVFPEPAGWLTRFVNRSGLNCQVLCNHNSVGDYRDIDPGATSERVYSESQMHAYALEAIQKIERDMDEMRQTMAAAAEEIHEHWQSHCDAEGYGPANLQHRLEGQYGVNYPGYTLGAFERLAAERDSALATIEAIRASATSAPEQTEADRKIITLTNQLLELQLLIQRRPAMNIGLFEAYEKWNGECYLLDWMNAVDNATPQPAEGS